MTFTYAKTPLLMRRPPIAGARGKKAGGAPGFVGARGKRYWVSDEEKRR